MGRKINGQLKENKQRTDGGYIPFSHNGVEIFELLDGVKLEGIVAETEDFFPKFTLSGLITGEVEESQVHCIRTRQISAETWIDIRIHTRSGGCFMANHSVTDVG